MKKLFLKLIRDMLASKGQFISIIFVIATGVGFFAGLFVVTESLIKNVDGFYEETNLADIWAYYTGINQSGIDNIKTMGGVIDAEGRIKVSASSANAADNKEFFVYTLPENNAISTPYVTDGVLPKDASECIVCEPYAEHNNLKVGNSVSLIILGKNYDFTISGLFLDSEYVFQIKDPSVAVPDYQNFGIIFIHHDMANELLDGAIYNEVIITKTDSTDTQEIIKELQEETLEYGFAYAIPREKQISYSIIDYKISSISNVCKVFPILFFIVAAALIFISMSRLVASQRGQIGVMKALGKSKKVISIHFLSFTVTTGLIGGVIGSVIGMTVLPTLIMNLITEFFSMPPVQLYGGSFYALIGSVLAIVIGSLAAYLSCRSILKESAAQLMRPKPLKTAKKIWIEKREGVWKRLSYKTKLILRNIFLNSKRTVIGSVGIIGGCALIFASFAVQGTYSYCLDDYMTNSNNYDMQIITDGAYDNFENLLESYKGIVNVSRMAKLSVMILKDDEEIETNITALPVNSEAVRLYEEKGNRLHLPGDGIVMSEKMAGTHDIQIGDSITLKIAGANGTIEVKTKVSGICRSYFGQGLFASFDALESLDIIPAITIYNASIAGDVESVLPSIQNIDGVKAVYTKQDLDDSMASAQDLITAVIFIMIAASAILTLAVIYNITSINIFDRYRDIATLRVLGYHHKEVGRLILVENLLVTTFGSVLGVALGFAMQYALISFIGTADTNFPFMLVWMSIPVAVCSVFLFTLIVNLLTRKKIRSIDMVESLKSVE